MTTLVLATDAPIVSGPPQGRWTFHDWETLLACAPTVTLRIADLFSDAPDTSI